MKKIIFYLTIIIFSLLLCFSLVSAQQEEEVTWKEKHSDRSALVLLKEVNVELKDDWSVIEKTHYKFKIQKEDARALGEIPLHYDKSRENIVDIKAYTITPDGERHRYSKIQDFQVYKGYPMYSDARVKVITMPEVNVGSIIECEYTVVADRMPIENHFWYVDYVPPKAAFGEFKLTVILPKSANVKYKEFNLEHKPKIEEDESRVMYSWHLKEIDDRRETEEFLPPPDLDNIEDCVEFSSIESWADISDWYWGLVEKNLVVNKRIEDKVQELIEGKELTRDKIRIILEYIQENFRYVSMSFDEYALEPHPTKQVFGNKYGDCKDLSLLCMAMLKFAGIKSYITLFNDEFSITDPQYDLPFPWLFDHALLLVKDSEEGDFYIDPLLDGCDISQYPLSYQGAYTFIITEDGGRFGRFSIFDEMRDYSESMRTITIYPDGSALRETKSLWSLDISIRTRYEVDAMNEEEKEKFFQRLEANIALGGEVLDNHIEGLEEKYGILKSHTKIRNSDQYPVIDDMIIIDLGDYDRSFDFTEKERKKPIFYRTNSLEEEMTTYRIPEGFRISYVPKNLNLDIGFFSVERKYEKKENEIVVTEITRNRRIELPREEYDKVKDFFDQLPRKTKQRIVLKKIKPWWQEIKDMLWRITQ